MALPDLIEAEDLFQTTIWNPLLDFGLAALFAQFPYLNWWPLNASIKFFARKLTDAIFKALTDVLNLRYVILKNLGMQKMFVQHQLKMKGVAIEKGTDSQEFKDAKNKAKIALAAKVRSLLVRDDLRVLPRTNP